MVKPISIKIFFNNENSITDFGNKILIKVFSIKLYLNRFCYENDWVIIWNLCFQIQLNYNQIYSIQLKYSENINLIEASFLTRTQACPKVSMIIVQNDNNGKKEEPRACSLVPCIGTRGMCGNPKMGL